MLRSRAIAGCITGILSLLSFYHVSELQQQGGAYRQDNFLVVNDNGLVQAVAASSDRDGNLHNETITNIESNKTTSSSTVNSVPSPTEDPPKRQEIQVELEEIPTPSNGTSRAEGNVNIDRHSPQPTLLPTSQPTPLPTLQPTPNPTLPPSQQPTLSPTPEPSHATVQEQQQQSQRKHAIIVPYRQRQLQLRALKEFMADHLPKHYPNDRFSIWIIEQQDSEPFNQAWLANVGLREITQTIPEVECITLHNVDFLPDANNTSVRYNECYPPVQQGATITTMLQEHWKHINGYSNYEFGKSGKDHGLNLRLQQSGLPLGNIHAAGTTTTTTTIRQQLKSYDRNQQTRIQSVAGNRAIQKIQQKGSTDGIRVVQTVQQMTTSGGNSVVQMDRQKTEPSRHRQLRKKRGSNNNNRGPNRNQYDGMTNVKYTITSRQEETLPQEKQQSGRPPVVVHHIKAQQQLLEFVHIPKSAGSAIEKAAAKAGVAWGACHWKNELSEEMNCPRPFDFQNLGIRCNQPQPECRGQMWHVPSYNWNRDVLASKKSFCVVRNPYDRVLSIFYDHWHGYQRPTNDTAVLNQFIQRKLRRNAKDDKWRRPQSKYVFDDAGTQVVSHVLRYEYLAAEFGELMQRYNLTGITLDTGDKYNHGGNEFRFQVSDFDNQTLALIQHLYSPDFDKFGYKRLLGREQELQQGQQQRPTRRPRRSIPIGPKRHAILVPYREGLDLSVFKDFMAEYLPKNYPNSSFSIWVIEQDHAESLDGPWVANVGLSEIISRQIGEVDCITLHDMDLLPHTNTTIAYTNSSNGTGPVRYDQCDMPLLAGPQWNTSSGGVTIMSQRDWRRTNGYSNFPLLQNGENHGLSLRLQQTGLLIGSTVAGTTQQPPQEDGKNQQTIVLSNGIRFNRVIQNNATNQTRTRHNSHTILQQIPSRQMRRASIRYRYDGIASVKYNVTSHQQETIQNQTIDNKTIGLMFHHIKAQQPLQVLLEFVHIPKSAGSAIEKAAANAGVAWGACHWDHQLNKEMGCPKPSDFQNLGIGCLKPQPECSSEMWHVPSYNWDLNLLQDKKTFCVVRNPYDRVLSIFYDRWHGYKNSTNDTAILNEFIQRKLTKKEQEDKWRRPQAKYVYNTNGTQVVDHVLKYENLMAEFAGLMQDYNLTHIALEVDKYNHGGNEFRFQVSDFNNKTLTMIEEVYGPDFDTFGYNRLPPVPPDPPEVEGNETATIASSDEMEDTLSSNHSIASTDKMEDTSFDNHSNWTVHE